MREHIVISGRLVPTTGVVRGPLLLGDQERWFRSIRTTATSVILRQMALMAGALLVVPALMAVLGAPWELLLALSAAFPGILLLSIPMIYIAWVTPMVNGYRQLGLSPGPHANGLELPCLFIGRPMFYPQTKTVFVPYPEIAGLDTIPRPWIWYLQGTANIWLRDGKRLRVPMRLLGEDGVAMTRDALARGPATAVAPRLVLYGPTSMDGPRPMPEGQAPRGPGGPDRG